MSKKTTKSTSKFSRGIPQVQKFEDVQKLHATPFPGQRSHIAHLLEVAFLRTRKPLCGPQLSFAIVEYPHPQTGQIVKQLLDGYTRIEAVMQKLMLPPADGLVNTETYKVGSFAEAKELYNWYNNTATGKRSKHEVQSAVRQCTNGAADGFSSHLMTKGPFVSALRHCGISESTVFDKVVTGFDAFRRLDALNLRKTRETTGALAAYLVLAQHEPDQDAARSFINKMNQYVFVPDGKHPEHLAIVFARDFHEDRVQSKMTAGTENGDTIRDHLLKAFTVFRLTRDNLPVESWVEQLRLGSYLADASDRRKAA